MLPVLIFEPDEALRADLLKELVALSEAGISAPRVDVSTGSLADIQRAIQGQTSIFLSILGVPKGHGAVCAEMGGRIMRQNRDNYTLFFLHDPADLEELLGNCIRPAGILTAPLNSKYLRGNMKRIQEDYRNNVNPAAADDCLVVESGGNAWRIPYDSIVYLEALNKMLTIHTLRQSITVRHSLAGLVEKLPEELFFRCHRAFVVNRQFIDRVDYNDMFLTVRSGDDLPVSRGQRTVLKQLMDSRKGTANER